MDSPLEPPEGTNPAERCIDVRIVDLELPELLESKFLVL